MTVGRERGVGSPGACRARWVAAMGPPRVLGSRALHAPDYPPDLRPATLSSKKSQIAQSSRLSRRSCSWPRRERNRSRRHQHRQSRQCRQCRRRRRRRRRCQCRRRRRRRPATLSAASFATPLTPTPLASPARSATFGSALAYLPPPPSLPPCQPILYLGRPQHGC